MSTIIGLGIVEAGLPHPDLNNLDDAYEKGFKRDVKTLNIVTSKLQKLLKNLKVKTGKGIEGGNMEGGDDVMMGGLIAGGELLKSYSDKIKKHSNKVEHVIDDILKLKVVVDKIMDSSDINGSKIHNVINEQFQHIVNVLGEIINISKEELSSKIKNVDEYLNSLKSLEFDDTDKDHAAKLSLLVKGLHDVDNVKSDVEKTLSKIHVKNLSGLKPVELFNKILDSVANLDTDDVNNLSYITKQLKSNGKGGRLVNGQDETTHGNDNIFKKNLQLSDKLEIIKVMYSKVLEEFLKEILTSFNSYTKIFYELSKSFNKTISYNKDFERLLKFLDNFSLTINLNTNDNTPIWYDIVGFVKKPESISNKNEFIANINTLIQLTEKSMQSQSGAKQYFEKMVNILKNILSAVDNYSKVIDLTTEKIKSLDINDVKGYGDVSGGSDFSINIELNSLNDLATIERESHDINKYLQSIRLFGNIANVQNNLTYVAKDIKSFSANYENLLGETMGFKKTKLDKDEVKIINSINNTEKGLGYLLNNYNRIANILKTKDSSNDNNKKMKNLINPQPMNKNFLIKICKWQFEAHRQFYDVLECIDLFLLNFTISLDSNLKDIEKLSDLLENVKINKEWFDSKNIQLIVQDALNNVTDAEGTLPRLYKNEDLIEKIKTVNKILHSVTPLKNILALFSYMNNMSAYKLQISPKNIYKFIKNYICASSFVCGFNHKLLIDYNNVPAELPSHFASLIMSSIWIKQSNRNYYDYEGAAGDRTYKKKLLPNFNLNLFNAGLRADVGTGIEAENPINLNDGTLSEDGNIVDNTNDQLEILIKKLRNRETTFTEIFNDDDYYLLLLLKALTSKIITSLSLYKSYKNRNSLTNNNAQMITSPIRLILGGANPTINDNIVELYIRMPLLVEFYKNIFNDSNKDTVKDHDYVTNDGSTELISYVPDLTGTWSGLISLIFNKSKYSSSGYYDNDTVKQIIDEINKIYDNYSKTSSDKSIKGCIMALVYEINRRYGIVKKETLKGYYDTIKKYQYTNTDTDKKIETNFVNHDADILDDSSDYINKLPSEKFVKSNEITFNLTKEQQHLIDDIPLIKNFRDKIHDSLNKFKDAGSVVNRAVSYNNYIQLYTKEVRGTSDPQKKLSIIVNAIKSLDKTQTNNNNNNDIAFYDFVLNPFIVLNSLFNFYKTNNKSFLNRLNVGTNDINADKVFLRSVNIDVAFAAVDTARDAAPAPNAGLDLLNDLYKYNNGLTSCSFDPNNSENIILEWSNLEKIVDNLITQIKSNLNRFRNLIDIQNIKLITEGGWTNRADRSNPANKKLYSIVEIEQLFLNFMIRNDTNVDKTSRGDILTFNTINKVTSSLVSFINATNKVNLYNEIVCSKPNFELQPLDQLQNFTLTKDSFKKYQKKTGTSEMNTNVYIHKRFIQLPVDNDGVRNDKASLVELFNITLTKYMNELYDVPLKKFYGKLLNNFYSNYVIEHNQGIYSMITPDSEYSIKKYMQPLLYVLKPLYTVNSISTLSFETLITNRNLIGLLLKQVKLTLLLINNIISQNDYDNNYNSEVDINNVLPVAGVNWDTWTPYRPLFAKFNDYIGYVNINNDFTITSIKSTFVNSNNSKPVENDYNKCFAFVNFNEVVTNLNIKSIFNVYNKVLPSSLPDLKYFLENDKNRVSSYMQNKFKTLLPRFKELFEEINNKSLFLQNLLFNTNNYGDGAIVNVLDNLTLQKLQTNTNKHTILFNDEYVSNQYNGVPLTNDQLPNCYKNSLINIHECCDLILSDIQNVMDEFADESLPMYLELKPNSIQSYKRYNNNNIPFMPLTFASNYAINNFTSVLTNKVDEKYFFGLKSILDVNYQNVKSLANMPYVESLLNNYSAMNDDYHKLDSNKIFGTIKNTMTVVQALAKNRLLHNNYHTANFNVDNKNCSFTNESINNYIQNSLDSSSKTTFCNAIDSCLINDGAGNLYVRNAIDNPPSNDRSATPDPTIKRNESILINIIDLNINPINIHALLKEIPLANIINYAFTYDDIVNSNLININMDAGASADAIAVANNKVKKYLIDNNNINEIFKADDSGLLFNKQITIDGNQVLPNKFVNSLHLAKNAIDDPVTERRDALTNNQIKNAFNTPLVNNLLFCVNAQTLIVGFLNSSKDVKVDKILTGIDLLNNDFLNDRAE